MVGSEAVAAEAGDHHSSIVIPIFATSSECFEMIHYFMFDSF